jgi:hypothetical protein
LRFDEAIGVPHLRQGRPPRPYTHRFSSPPQPAVGHDRRRGARAGIAAHQRHRGVDDGGALGGGDGVGAPLGMDAAEEEYLALEDIADAGDDPLVEQDVGDRTRTGRGEPPESFVAIERARQEVGSERGKGTTARQVAGPQELRDR